MFIAMQGGMSWAEAWALDPLMRRAFALRVAQWHGNRVDWRTGRILPPEGGR